MGPSVFEPSRFRHVVGGSCRRGLCGGAGVVFARAVTMVTAGCIVRCPCYGLIMAEFGCAHVHRQQIMQCCAGLFVLLGLGCQRRAPFIAPETDTGILADTAAQTCPLDLSVREDGLVGFVWSDDGDPPMALDAEVAFFQGAVRISMSLSPDQSEGTIPFVPVYRDDEPAVQAYFEQQEGSLSVDVSLTVHGENRSCSSNTSVGFRQWRDASEGDCLWNGFCEQQDADVRLPTTIWADPSAPTALEPLSDLITARIHHQQTEAGPNYSVVMLEATGTPLAITMLNKEALEVTGEVSVSDNIQSAFHVWWQGQELAVTNGYPSREGHPSVLALFDADEQLRTAVDPTEDGLLLHHDGVVRGVGGADSGDEIEIYGLNWTARDNGRSLGQKTTVVRFHYQPSLGRVVADSVETLFDVDALMSDITYVYGNSISLSPAGADDRQWFGVTFANDTGFGELEDEARRALAVVWEMAEDGPEDPPVIFVNEGIFDEGLLIEPTNAQIIGLPADPLDGQVPLDQVHKVLFFQTTPSQYTLIVGALVRAGDNTANDKRARVFVYDVTLPQDSEASPTVSWVCGATIETENQSHQDILVPHQPHQNTVMAVGSGAPHGETWYWDYGAVTGDSTRCKTLAWHGLRDVDRDQTPDTAVNTWQKSVVLRHLAAGVVDAEVVVDMDAISAAYAPLSQ